MDEQLNGINDLLAMTDQGIGINKKFNGGEIMTGKLKKALCIVLSIGMILSSVSVAYADEIAEYEAEINGTKYETVHDAISHVTKGGTVKLLKNIDLTETIVVQETAPSFTLDLNGKTMNGSGITDKDHKSVIINWGKLTITDSSALSNGTITGGKGSVADDTIVGGGICNVGKLAFNSGNISHNSAEYGGGIYNLGKLTISGGNISYNTADHGGGIYNNKLGDSGFTATGGTISYNEASEGGGGICSFLSSTISGISISNNKALFGGGMCLSDGTQKISGVTISGNQATNNGGGIYNIKSSVTEIKNSTITGNKAVDGAGINNSQNATLKISGTVVSGNIADYQAGGIYNDAKLTIDGTSDPVTITNNKTGSTYPAAGIYSWKKDGNSIVLKGKVVIKDNTTSGKAANLCLSGELSGNYSYSPIKVNGLSAGSEIGVSLMQNDVERDVSLPAAFTETCNKDYSGYFFADNAAKCSVKYNAGGCLELVGNYGSESAPISDGAWIVGPTGEWQYKVNGETLKDTTAWISYAGDDGKTYTGCFYFDESGNMATNWHKIDDVWYFFDTTDGVTFGMMKI